MTTCEHCGIRFQAPHEEWSLCDLCSVYARIREQNRIWREDLEPHLPRYRRLDRIFEPDR